MPLRDWHRDASRDVGQRNSDLVDVHDEPLPLNYRDVAAFESDWSGWKSFATYGDGTILSTINTSVIGELSSQRGVTSRPSAVQKFQDMAPFSLVPITSGGLHR
jgi:hypothetical protein